MGKNGEKNRKMKRPLLVCPRCQSINPEPPGNAEQVAITCEVCLHVFKTKEAASSSWSM